MSSKDIRPLGAGDGIGYYWIKEQGSLGGSLRLVAITELGEVTRTELAARWEDAALTEHEAVAAHLAGGISVADVDLERRRREAPEPEPEPPQMDPATRRFLTDGGEWDLS